MKRLLFFILFLLPTAAGCTVDKASAPGHEGDQATVLYVIDGDTIQVEMNGDEYRVRYVGVNTPERDEPCYTDATKANADLVEDRTVRLVRDVSDTDQYGRLLRYVYVGDTFVNAELVKDGWAESNRYPPDTSQHDYLEDLESDARSHNLGCYPTGVFD
jgi:micrococcal nuclease